MITPAIVLTIAGLPYSCQWCHNFTLSISLQQCWHSTVHNIVLYVIQFDTVTDTTININHTDNDQHFLN